DANHIRTLEDNFKPSQEGYKNTIELPVASNWLERIPAGSITTWEDLTTRFLAQFFPPGRTTKLHNDILMFQQHHEESLSEAWTRPIPQPQALGTTFEARVWDYMAAHTEWMERFENAIFKQREEINDRMVEMFGLLKELTTSRGMKRGKMIMDNIKKATEIETEVAVKESKTKNGAENKTKNKPIKKAEKEEAVKAPSSQPVEHYLKHMINKKLIEGLVDNHRKKITRKEDIKGNFKILYNIGGLKHMNALVDQGSDVNVMPLSAYMKLTDERPAETDIRLSLASHSYIYPLGIVKDVLVKVAEHVYPVDFVILGIKENKKRPFILGTPFLTTAKAMIKFDKVTITLRSEKTPTMTINRLVLEWEEKIKLHQEKEIEFDQWRNKNFKNERPAPVKIKDGMDDEGEVT
ncbi:zinc finger, CCHC-type containing protein, partial [Tanacetum coccineum]